MTRIKHILTLSLLILMSIGVTAQTNVTIRGTMENGAGKRVELRCYTDVLTSREVLLDSARVAADGAFALACYVNYPRLVIVQVERYSQSFYIEPGRTYEVYLPEFDWDIDEKQNIFLDPVALPLEFLNLPAEELNLGIKAFEDAVDSFVSSHRQQLDRRFRPSRHCLDTLEAAVGARRGDTTDSFLGRYKEYRLAEMRLAMGMTARKTLIKKYIEDMPIRYHDEEYMRLFLALYEHSVSKGTKRVPQWRLVEWVRVGDLPTMLDSLGLDPLLRNEQVRELAALQALKEAFYDPAYDRYGVVRMVARLGEATKFAEHRTLAANLGQEFTSAEGGGTLPPVVLPDVEHRQESLDSFKGKWVYLSFVRVGDPNCLREIETMAHFRDTVYSRSSDVVFVSVVCDREFQKMYHLLKNSRKGSRYNWTWLHFDGRYDLLERYGVVSYPTFVLLTPEGVPAYDYTPSPGSGLLLRGPWEKPAEMKDFGKPYFGK